MLSMSTPPRVRASFNYESQRLQMALCLGSVPQLMGTGGTAADSLEGIYHFQGSAWSDDIISDFSIRSDLFDMSSNDITNVNINSFINKLLN